VCLVLLQIRILTFSIKRTFPVKVNFWTLWAHNGFDPKVCHCAGHKYSSPCACAALHSSHSAQNLNSKFELFFSTFFAYVIWKKGRACAGGAVLVPCAGTHLRAKSILNREGPKIDLNREGSKIDLNLEGSKIDLNQEDSKIDLNREGPLRFL